LVRTNVNGRAVPAILGGPIVISALLALLCIGVLAAVGWKAAEGASVAVATSLLLAAMGAAGAWDDMKGDERPRGFAGHLGAMRARRLTGGVVKAATGLVAGVIAGWIVANDLPGALEIGLLVALSANLTNLFDRAPGRAAKVTLFVTVPLVVWGSPSWAVMAGGAIGALVASMPFDLRQRAMLGDAGANAVGAVMGLGLGVSLPPAGRLIALAVLAALNVASEKWSFSRVIAQTSWLRYLDRLGTGK
jgi:hypothetical protein